MHSIERIDFHLEQNTLILISRALAAGLGARNLIEVSAFCPVIARASPHALLTRPLAGLYFVRPLAVAGARSRPDAAGGRHLHCSIRKAFSALQ